LRDAGFQGEIVLVGAEPVPPYERPHLSKGYLLGTVPRQKLALRPAAQYEELAVHLRLGERVVELDLGNRRVLLQSGEGLAWDALCLTPGSSARLLSGYENGIYLRELPDADRLRDELDTGRPLNIIGAGFIGCEVAAAGRGRGVTVTAYEALEQPLLRVLGPQLGEYLASVHRDHGVDLHLGVKTLPTMPAPAVVGVGSEPRTELARAAGIAVDGGILVDDLGRTSAPSVFAAGDATRFWSPYYAASIRVEHFQTSQRHGFAVGRAMAGVDLSFDEVPWFWSDQYDLNLQYAGAGLAWDETVVRGSFGRPPFSVFYLSEGGLVAVAGVNDHHTVARARRLMQERAAVSRAQMADPSFDLRTLLRPGGASARDRPRSVR
jgi:3-phenylpropionate/trans-cinnamate dioxygenase ferredoxin reductase subunit